MKEMKQIEETSRVIYFVNKNGEILSLNKNNQIFMKRKLQLNKGRGYYYFRTKKKNYIVHRLVAQAFLLNPSHRPEVNHIDGNKLNNNVDNLEWCTRQENVTHAINNNLVSLMKKNDGNIKYTNQQCLDVAIRVEQGMTYVKAGEIHGMPYSTVAHLVRGSRRKIIY